MIPVVRIARVVVFCPELRAMNAVSEKRGVKVYQMHVVVPFCAAPDYIVNAARILKPSFQVGNPACSMSPKPSVGL